MAYRSFQKFLDALEQAGELKRVGVPVDTDLLIAEWANREMKSPGGGKALLFEQPTDRRAAIAISRRDQHHGLAQAHGAGACKSRHVDDLAQEIQLILKAKPPTDLREGWSLLKQGIQSAARAAQACQGSAPARKWCTALMTRIRHASREYLSLHDLPILKCWPKDGGRFVTLPNVHTRDPDTGERNVGMYRMQVYDERTTGMHWQVHKVGARHGKRYYERGERMPVAVSSRRRSRLHLCRHRAAAGWTG